MYILIFPFVTTSDVFAFIKILNAISCLIDPLPVRIFKEYAQQLAPAVRNIIKNSLSCAIVPKELKESIITPIYITGCLDLGILYPYVISTTVNIYL